MKRVFLKKDFVFDILKEFKDSIIKEVIHYYYIDRDITESMEEDVKTIFESIIEKYNIKGDE